MREDYNSRQRKIYRDYNTFSTESLFEILKESDKYIPEVIGIINEILVERKAILPDAGPTVSSEDPDEIIPEDAGNEPDIFLNEVKRNDEELVKSFVNKLSEKSDSELSGIITRYIEYQSETVKAALILSVDRGVITYELREQISVQIDANYAAREKGIRRFRWESNNAFIKYVSGYQDEEIYSILEDPKGIVIDVYHAVLVTAKERELISEKDFTEFYKDAKLAIRTEREIERAEITEYLKSGYAVDDINESDDEVDIDSEKEKYWKCPVCNQLVEMEFGICWNCQSEIPQAVEHPDRAEVIKELSYRKPVSLFKIGFTLIACGIAVGLIEQLRHHSLFTFDGINYGGIAIGAFISLIGVIIIIYRLIDKARGEA